MLGSDAMLGRSAGAHRFEKRMADVENLWILRANPVENPTAQIFLCRELVEIAAAATSWCVFAVSSLDRVWRRRKIVSVRTASKYLLRGQRQLMIHRFEETIGGRPYQIEVTLVKDRWRAQLRRAPGMPTAMMPFYGTTPDAAARGLADWLTLAHRRRTGTPAPGKIVVDPTQN
jgi:hypothetical protein